MILIEPCCAPKQVPEMMNKIEDEGTVLWHGYGDLSMAELLPALLSRYCETKLMIVSPSVPDVAAEAITKTMRKKRARMDGTGNMDVIRHLTIVANLSEKRSPMASHWLKENHFPERLVLRDVQQNDTAIILPDIAFVGPMNLAYGGHFTAIATKNASTIDRLREMYEGL